MNKIIFCILTSFCLSVLILPGLIVLLKNYKLGQKIRSDGPKRHLEKEGTPTMGGIAILIAILIGNLFFIKFNKIYLILIVVFSSALLGFIDDYFNVFQKKIIGIKARYRIFFQFLIALFLFFVLFKNSSSSVLIPFSQKNLNLGYFYFPFVLIVFIGTINAVNLSDGIDGLACGVLAICFAVYIKLAILFKEENLALFSAILLGVCLGFLWFNIYPAKIFLGNTGSLALGSSLASLAILTKTEFYLFFIGIIFVLEALSVIIQVISFQTTGKRVFKMSPIHHHFELSGWSESQISTRFWLVSLIFALIVLLNTG